MWQPMKLWLQLRYHRRQISSSDDVEKANLHHPQFLRERYTSGAGMAFYFLAIPLHLC